MFELTKELHEQSKRIEKLAREEYKLDFFDIEFFLVPSRYLNTIASHTGFPNRYSHWTHGLEYERLKRRYDWGLGKIYELVINNDPSYAYLMENNSLAEQKLVMAHVCGHVSVFKNNLYFTSTRRDMVDVIAYHSSRISQYYKKYGIEEVESFLDSCLSISEHIDYFAPFVKKNHIPPSNTQTEDFCDQDVPKVKCDKHLDMFINPEKELKKRKEQMLENLKKIPCFPEKPEKDVLLFLLQYAPLKKWQEDILFMLREESYYFNPQRQTKIVHEGFASYFHFRMMTEHLLEPSEIVEFALDHSGTLGRSPYNINPYYFGFTLLKDIEKRYNEGRFGIEYENCTDSYKKDNWNQNGVDGYKKLMEIMVVDNDYSLVDKYFTKEFCEEYELYKYEFNQESEQFEISSRDFRAVKDQFLNQLANSGIPYIAVADGNFGNKNELLLLHRHEYDLNQKYAEDTLKNIAAIWKRPVHLLTKYDDEYKMLTHGTSELEFSSEKLEELYKTHCSRL